MALSAEEIAVNAAVVALGTAWNAMIATKAVGSTVRVVFGEESDNGAVIGTLGPPSLAGGKAAASVAYMTKHEHRIPRATNAASNFYFIGDPSLVNVIGGIPLFWKVTNEENLLTSE